MASSSPAANSGAASRAKAANTIFVDRTLRADVVRVNQLIQGVLDAGRGVLVFPEGTSSPGHEVLTFKSSLLEPAIKIGHPVAVASLAYGTPPGWPGADASIAWWGDMTFPRHFYGMLRIPRFDALLRFGEGSHRAESRHELARSLHSAVSAQFVPTPLESPATSRPAS